MEITEQQVKSLLSMLALTRESEASCGDCLQHMAQFAEATLPGKPIHEGLKHIDDHLRLCGECREEFEALKSALDDETRAP